MRTYRWRKSSYSHPHGQCVELAASLDALRDSKDPNGPVLRVDVRSLINAVKVGRFSR